MKIHGVFITGTDTGIGKTLITAMCCHSLRQSGIDALPMKPVQTGGKSKLGRLRSPDIDEVLRLANISINTKSSRLLNPYCYATAVSPHLAAKKSRRPIKIDYILENYKQLKTTCEYVVVEGAGGILSPLTTTLSMGELARRMQLPVILVARPGLGTINHTLLTLRELGRIKCRVAGIVFNSSEHSGWGESEVENRKFIPARTGIPAMASIPYIPHGKGDMMDIEGFIKCTRNYFPDRDTLTDYLSHAVVPAF